MWTTAKSPSLRSFIAVCPSPQGSLVAKSRGRKKRSRHQRNGENGYRIFPERALDWPLRKLVLICFRKLRRSFNSSLRQNHDKLGAYSLTSEPRCLVPALTARTTQTA